MVFLAFLFETLYLTIMCVFVLAIIDFTGEKALELINRWGHYRIRMIQIPLEKTSATTANDSLDSPAKVVPQ